MVMVHKGEVFMIFLSGGIFGVAIANGYTPIVVGLIGGAGVIFGIMWTKTKGG